MCSVAKRLSARSPVVLLSGGMELSASFDIEAHVERYLTAAFGHNVSSWVDCTADSLRADGQRIFVLIDAVNETTSPQTLLARLRQFVARTRGSRVRVVVSCRDVGWEQFAGAFESSLNRPLLRLDAFTETEWAVVVARYFTHFKVKATLADEAKLALRNPVLLGFFCRVHRGEDVGHVATVRLADVFDMFLERLEASAHESLGSANAGATTD